MNRLLIAQVAISLVTLLGALLVTLTIWATSKSMERTECYRHATSVEQCPQPGWLERQVRRAL